MSEIQLNDRLKKTAEFVRQGAVLADIGTDHGYLPVWLIESGKINNAIAADINPGPLSKAEQTVIEHNLKDRVQLALSDGLKSVDLTGVTDIAVAGMGGELIAKIIEDRPEIRNSEYRLILQPMTNADRLRRYLCENGFTITEERGVTDRRFTYCVLCVQYTGKRFSPDDFYCAVGEMPRNADTESVLYVQGQIKKSEKKIAGLKRAANPQNITGEQALLERLYNAAGEMNENSRRD